MWPLCTTQTRVFNSDPRCLTKCPREERRRGVTSPAASSTVPGAAGQNGFTLRDLLGLLGSKGRKTEGGGRRGVVVAGVGAATSTRRRCWCPFPVRRCVNARAMACAGKRARRVRVMARLGVSRNRGVAAGNAAEPGPAPRVAASTASAVGTRACVRGSAGGKACTWRSRERRSPPLVTVCTSYPATARPWRRGRPKRGGESRRKRKGPKVPTRTAQRGVAIASGTTRRTTVRRIG
jgi:hypothetical protein